MAYQPKDNTGNLFKNESENPKAPVYKGSCMVNGVEMDMAAWIQTSDRTGKQYMSIKFQEPYQKPEQAPPQQQAPVDLEDDIPF